MESSTESRYVDPDPFTVVSLVLSATGVLLQFPQTYDFFKEKYKAKNPLKDNGQRESNITHLLDAIDDAEKHLNRIIRSIEKGAKSPEKEFFHAKFGISLGIMKLELSQQKQFQRNLSHLYAKMGALSLWANQIIGSDDELASALGRVLAEKCSDANLNLNEMMASGATNSQILDQANFIFSTMKSSLKNVLEKRNL